MTKKHEELVEELVEEIAEKIVKYYDSCPIPAKEDREMAKDIISLILSAVRDGLPLPGEVGRWIPKSAGGDEAGGGFAWRILKEIGHAPILIALDPLTGIGKEGTESARVYHPDTKREA